jgi:hypothetical protein
VSDRTASGPVGSTADGYAGWFVEREPPVGRGFPPGDDGALAGSVDVVEDHRRVGGKLLRELWQRWLAAGALPRATGRRTVHDQQVDFVGILGKLVQSVPRRLALERGMYHARDLIQRLALQLSLDERGPAAGRAPAR